MNRVSEPVPIAEYVLKVASRDERAAAALRRILGDDHPYAVCASHNLAMDLALLADTSGASDWVEGDIEPPPT